MLKLKKIKLRNWGSIRSAELELPPHGLVLVTGINTEGSHGKLQSVGAGKSLVLEGICRSLFGSRGRYTQLGHYSCEQSGSKNTLVEVEADLSGKALSVQLGYKCNELSKTGEGLRFVYDGSEIQRGHIDDTRTELSTLVNVTPDLSEWTVFIDGDRLSFNRLSEKDAVELVMTALSQPPWAKYHAHAAKILGDFKVQSNVAKARYEEAVSAVDKAVERLSNAKRQLEAEQRDFETRDRDRRAKLTEAKRKREEVEAELASVNGSLAEIKKQRAQLEEEHSKTLAKLDQAVLDCKSKLSEERKKIQPFEDKKSKLQHDLRHLKDRLETYRRTPTRCPECGQNLPASEDSAQGRDALNEKIKKVEEDLFVANDRHRQQSRFYADAEEDLEEATRKVRDHAGRGGYVELSRRQDQLDDKKSRLVDSLSSANSRISQLELPTESEVAELTAIVEARQRDLDDSKQKRDEQAAALADSQAATKVIQYWTDGFGPTGIPNMILRETIAPLNEASRRMSQLLTGGTIGVSYSTKKLLATGREKAELIVQVNNVLGSKRADGGSKGETGLINLIVAETLAEVGQVHRRVGFRCYDEVVKSQDQVVRRSIFTYLKDLALRRQMLIFVVDHSVESANYADKVLVVEKTSQGSILRWS